MHFNRFVLKIIFAKKQLVVFVIMFFSSFLIILFFLFFKTFTTYYIDELKLIYPSLYLIKNKEITSYKRENLEVYSEIFELNIDNFFVSFDKKENFTLGSLGIRSFHKSHKPKILKDIETKNTIFLSKNIFDQLKNFKNFKNVLYIKSDRDAKMYKFKVKQFKLHDNSKWILFENSEASKLYRNSLFNKASFYATKYTINDIKLKKKLKKEFPNIIYSWDEHISLLSRALKEGMLYLFSLISMAIIVLSISSIIFLTRELTDDLIHFTKYAFFYAISLKYVFFSYVLIFNLIIITTVFLSYLIAFNLNDLVTLTLWKVPSYSANIFLYYIPITILFITSSAIFIALKKLYFSKSYGFSNG